MEFEGSEFLLQFGIALKCWAPEKNRPNAHNMNLTTQIKAGED